MMLYDVKQGALDYEKHSVPLKHQKIQNHSMGWTGLLGLYKLYVKALISVTTKTLGIHANLSFERSTSALSILVYTMISIFLMLE